MNKRKENKFTVMENNNGIDYDCGNSVLLEICVFSVFILQSSKLKNKWHQQMALHN